MAKYRAIVSITFDDHDLEVLAADLDVKPGRLDPQETVSGTLDNLDFGEPWLEQFFIEGEPQIRHLTGGIWVEVRPHEDD